MAKLTDRTSLVTEPADGDLVHIVDISDLTDSPQGTSKKTAYSNIKSGIKNIYNANTILKADTDNIPVALPIANSQFVGRTSASSIKAMTVTESKTELGAGLANGLATLDGGGKIPAAQLPSSVMDFKGNWNATTNSPTLADGVGDAGDVYLVSVAGSQDLGSGSITFAAGDWCVYNGSIWEKSVNSNAVASVFTRTGAVVSANGDYTASQLTNVPAGNIAAVTVQSALDELDTEKVNITDQSILNTDYWLQYILNRVNFVTTEPVGPSLGDRYLNIATGTSSVTTQAVTESYIYNWNGSTWTEIIPEIGAQTFNVTEKTTSWYFGIPSLGWKHMAGTLLKVSDPSINDDVDKGYTNSATWLNTTTDEMFVCVDETAGAAIWHNASFNNGIQNLTLSEATQLLNINSTTISAAQWDYLGAIDVTKSPVSTINYVASKFSTHTGVNAFPYMQDGINYVTVASSTTHGTGVIVDVDTSTVLGLQQFAPSSTTRLEIILQRADSNIISVGSFSLFARIDDGNTFLDINIRDLGSTIGTNNLTGLTAFSLSTDKLTMTVNFSNNTIKLFRNNVLEHTVDQDSGTWTTTAFNNAFSGWVARGMTLTHRDALAQGDVRQYASLSRAEVIASGALSTELSLVNKWMC